MNYKTLIFILALASLPDQSIAQTIPSETLAADKKWDADMINGPCSKLRDRYTDPPSVVAACHALTASQPPCLIYRNYAQIWFDMRASHDPAWPYQSQTLSELGKGNDEVLADRDPGLHAHLQRLLVATTNADLGEWKASDKWAAMAYSRCMAGQFF